MKWTFTLLLALTVLAFCPSTVSAQDGTISGTVTDGTNARLPGTTVEVSSPVLSEGPQVVFTDGAGRYSLGDLPYGIYSLTFSLSGFARVVVPDNELPAGSTVTVNARMSIAGLTENVAVQEEALPAGMIVGPTVWDTLLPPELPPRVQVGITLANTVRDTALPPLAPPSGHGITIANTVDGGPPPGSPRHHPNRGITVGLRQPGP